MNYIVLDLEWNQSSTPQGEIKEIPFEIIEIGAVKLSADKKMISEFNELIRPSIYKEMHKITCRLQSVFLPGAAATLHSAAGVRLT